MVFVFYDFFIREHTRMRTHTHTYTRTHRSPALLCACFVLGAALASWPTRLPARTPSPGLDPRGGDPRGGFGTQRLARLPFKRAEAATRHQHSAVHSRSGPGPQSLALVISFAVCVCQDGSLDGTIAPLRLSSQGAKGTALPWTGHLSVLLVRSPALSAQPCPSPAPSLPLLLSHRRLGTWSPPVWPAP